MKTILYAILFLLLMTGSVFFAQNKITAFLPTA